MGTYKLVIRVNMNQYGEVYSQDEAVKILMLDVVKTKSITASSTITNQPLQSGDTMSDHMYRNPTTFNVSGTFALNGENANDISYGFVGKENDRLTQIETLLEKIKDEGYLCDLITMSFDDNGKNDVNNTRFKVRKNMALTNITWSEKLNSIDYQLSFQEVITVDSIDTSEIVVDDDDPLVNEPEMCSLGNLIYGTEGFLYVLLFQLYNNKIISYGFIYVLANWENTIPILKQYPTLQKAAKEIVAYKNANGSLATPSEDVVEKDVNNFTYIGLAFGILKNIFSNNKYLLNPKKLYTYGDESDSSYIFYLDFGHLESVSTKTATEKVTKFIKFLDSLFVDLNKLTYSLEVYNFENVTKNQTTILAIGGNYYYITPILNNTLTSQGTTSLERATSLGGARTNRLNVTKPDRKLLSGFKVVCDDVEIASNFTPVTSLTQMNNTQNLWFRSIDGDYEVYLANTTLSQDTSRTQTEQNDNKNNLSYYTIWVSKGDIRLVLNNLMQTITKNLQSYKFE